MNTVRNVAATCLEEGVDFRMPFQALDADGDGRLTLPELGAALRRAGAPLALSQVTALFRYFDPAELGTISRRYIHLMCVYKNTGTCDNTIEDAKLYIYARSKDFKHVR
ncbi:unnamed protein product [Sphacelaria rigidula]